MRHKPPKIQLGALVLVASILMFGFNSCYSFRGSTIVVNSYTGSAINVRRDSDDATQNVGFTPSGDLDTASLLAFTGTSSGYVKTWYDQSGHGYNATQTTTTKQPRVVDTGVVTISGTRSRPTVQFSFTATVLSYSGGSHTVQTVVAMRDLKANNVFSYLFSMPANSDFSIRLLAAFNGSFPTSYIVPGSINDWLDNTPSPHPMWINGVRTKNVNNATLHRLVAIANVPITASSWSISSTFMSRGMNNSSGVSELILFANSISNADRIALDGDQQAYY